MVERFFPSQVDNNFRGHWIGLVMFVLVIIAKGGQAIQTIIHTRQTAIGPDAISLAGLNSSQVDEILSLFAVIGLYALILPVLGLVVLARWRALIPFIYLCFIAFYFANRLLHLLHPSFANERTSYGTYVNLGILAVMIVGLLFSSWTRGRSERPDRRQPSAR
jgi:hypothetical protein